MPPMYELLYHAGAPGRGEFIRLVFAAAKVPYTDVGNVNEAGAGRVRAICVNNELESSDGQPPVFSPPALRVLDEDSPAPRVQVLSQTGNILSYLGARFGLDGGETQRYEVAQVALTALDLTNEVHDTHHPIATADYYEDQRDAALLKAADVRTARLPKFFSYFSRVLEHNRKNANGRGKYLVGEKLTYADLTVWQALDGVFFAFPNEMREKKKEFPALLGTFYDNIKTENGIREYLTGGTRIPYSAGIWRNYPELDRQ